MTIKASEIPRLWKAITRYSVAMDKHPFAVIFILKDMGLLTEKDSIRIKRYGYQHRSEVPFLIRDPDIPSNGGVVAEAQIRPEMSVQEPEGIQTPPDQKVRENVDFATSEDSEEVLEFAENLVKNGWDCKRGYRGSTSCSR